MTMIMMTMTKGRYWKTPAKIRKKSNVAQVCTDIRQPIFIPDRTYFLDLETGSTQIHTFTG